jgi:branched-chain amino acid transport system ATP-binding protein
VVDKNLKDLLALSDRHVILAKGAIVFNGRSDELRSDPELVHRWLGV